MVDPYGSLEPTKGRGREDSSFVLPEGYAIKPTRCSPICAPLIIYLIVAVVGMIIPWTVPSVTMKNRIASLLHGLFWTALVSALMMIACRYCSPGWAWFLLALVDLPLLLVITTVLAAIEYARTHPSPSGSPSPS